MMILVWCLGGNKRRHAKSAVETKAMLLDISRPLQSELPYGMQVGVNAIGAASWQ